MDDIYKYIVPSSKILLSRDFFSGSKDWVLRATFHYNVKCSSLYPHVWKFCLLRVYGILLHIKVSVLLHFDRYVSKWT